MTCRWCFAEFTPAPKARGQVFCSRRCVEQERNQRVRTCACGWRFSASSRHTTVCDWCKRKATAGPIVTILGGPSCRMRKPAKPTWRGATARPCRSCGATVSPGGKYLHAICAPCKQAKKKRASRLARIRRRGLLAVGSVPYRASDIFARDGHRCHLCGKRVSDKPVPHPMAATIDHLVPISAGGRDAPDNVATAHFVCNSRRGNRGIAQLRLVA